eukprot:gene9918-biopygen2540
MSWRGITGGVTGGRARDAARARSQKQQCAKTQGRCASTNTAATPCTGVVRNAPSYTKARTFYCRDCCIIHIHPTDPLFCP